MGKEKRKTRLNKGEGGEFIGFGAFAAPATGTGSLDTTSGGKQSPSAVVLSPVYLGSDPILTVLFPRIGQKRDATTKAKALQELKAYLADEDRPKKAQVDALAHFLYLYHTKLSYDNTPRVRASALECCHQAVLRLPKAWTTLTSATTAASSRTSTQQLELTGMIRCAQADPATEVRSVAKQVVQAMNKSTPSSSSSSSSPPPSVIDEGLWEYVQRILSYLKPQAMHQDLFAKVSQTTSNANGDAKLSDKQQEELEERFQRIVGTALGGMELFVREMAPSKPEDYILPKADIDIRCLRKHLSSPTATLRRKTYSLLSACCQRAPSLVDVEKVTKLLGQNLAAEKEPTNVKVLLETILAFVASRPKDQRSSILAEYTKPLTKLFGKGCHGATQWAPTVLPIVALLPVDAQPTVLTSVWQGRSHIVGNANELEVVAAVAETASFLLLKGSHDLSEVLAKCWLQALQTFLTYQKAASGPARAAHRKLGEVLAKDLTQLDMAHSQRPQSAMILLEEWFWKSELPQVLLDPSLQAVHISSFLQSLAQASSTLDTTTNGKGHLKSIWKGLFLQRLKQCQGDSGLVPSMEVYELWMALLGHLQLSDLFSTSPTNGEDNENDPTLESFLMNDLLRWMIIHTSNLSEQKDTGLAHFDFELLRLALPIAEPGSWDAVLRELIAAKVDWDILGNGLTLLVGTDHLESIRSPQLNELVHSVAQEALESVHENVDLDELSEASELHRTYQGKAGRLLQTCLGVGSIPGVLVDEAEIGTMVDLACPKDPKLEPEENAVLETLYLLTERKGWQDPSITGKVLLQTWRQGGDLWEGQVTTWLENKRDQASEIVQLARKELQSTLRQAASEAKVDSRFVLTWAERAVRLLSFCEIGGDETAVEPPSLHLIGLTDEQVWSKTNKGELGFASQVFVVIMGLVDSTTKRWSLFENCSSFGSSPGDLLIRILCGLSAGSSNFVEAHMARSKQDPCGLVLQQLGEAKLELVSNWIQACLNHLASILGKNGSQLQKASGIAVLSQLVSLGYPRIRPSGKTYEKDRLEVKEIREGDSLWYIPKVEHPSVREPCKIMKVHRDIPTEVYFTVQIQRDNGAQERQTVCERLRSAAGTARSDSSTGAQHGMVSVDEIALEEMKRRDSLVQVMMSNVILPTWDSWEGIEYEILHILISHVGILGARGIGSTHYTVFQKLISLQVELAAELATEGDWTQGINRALWKLAYSLGYGLNTEYGCYNLSLMGFDANATIDSLLRRLYEKEEENTKEPSIEALRACVAWITVASSRIEEANKLDKTKSLLYLLVSRLLQAANASPGGFQLNDFVSLRALEELQKTSTEVQSTEADALEALVKAFAIRWENEENEDSILEGKPFWDDLPVCSRVLEDKLKKRSRTMGIAARNNATSLATALYVNCKRWLALRLLAAYAKCGNPIHSNPDDAMNDLTSDKLDEWCADMIDDEAGELEEDVEIVCQWVPQPLLNEMESWQESMTQEVAFMNKDVYDRLACWLSYLQIVDVAASKDTMNRVALISYTTKCDAVSAILSLAIPFANIGTTRKVKLDDVHHLDDLLNNGDGVELSKLAALAIYRTVEVFPTLSKHWWEMTCPNYFREAVRDFVESTVSPEILRRELERIKKATSFGEMTVKGSAMSREVTALYTQDDFTLTVVIKIPLSFPFRRAEVDCSKTLGVPEKRWKRWSLQITQMLNNQGGTLQDALMLWKENVDKEFEGVEPCPVCYSVLHVKTHKLPDMECKTCQNRFHFDCLTQWFRSSGKSACVMCQQPWSGTRVQ